jgi:predicted ester cyclase
MSTEELKAKYQRLADVWNTGNLELLDKIFVDNVVYHIQPFPDMGLATLKQFITIFRQAFPDFHVTIDENIIVENSSAHRWTCRATYTGQSPLLPGPPTGKPATVLGSHIVHWAADKAVEVWHFGDWLGWLQQMGVLPPLG